MHSSSVLNCDVGSSRPIMDLKEQGLMQHKQMYCEMQRPHLLLNALIVERWKDAIPGGLKDSLAIWGGYEATEAHSA